MINSVVLAGNIVRDAELRHTKGGAAVVNFSIAVNERVKRGDQWEDKPNYFDIVMYGQRGEKVYDRFRRGCKVTIQGRLSHETWEAKDGSKRSNVKVIMNDFTWPEEKGGSGGGQPRQRQQPQGNYHQQQGGDDIPF